MRDVLTQLATAKLGENKSGRILMEEAADEIKRLRAAIAANVKLIEVTQPNGQPLPSPCAISGCQYDAMHTCTCGASTPNRPVCDVCQTAVRYQDRNR